MPRHLTPPDGSPIEAADDEKSVPILVPNPAMSRPRSPTERPKMTIEQFVEKSTLDRKAIERDIADIERDLAIMAKKLDIAGDRIGDLSKLMEVLAERVDHIGSDMQKAAGNFGSIGEFRERVVTALVDISGAQGGNGKLGNLTKRVDGIDRDLEDARGRRWQVIMFVLGLLLTAGGVIAWASGTVSDLRATMKLHSHPHP